MHILSNRVLLLFKFTFFLLKLVKTKIKKNQKLKVLTFLVVMVHSEIFDAAVLFFVLFLVCAWDVFNKILCMVFSAHHLVNLFSRYVKHIPKKKTKKRRRNEHGNQYVNAIQMGHTEKYCLFSSKKEKKIVFFLFQMSLHDSRPYTFTF